MGNPKSVTKLDISTIELFLTNQTPRGAQEIDYYKEAQQFVLDTQTKSTDIKGKKRNLLKKLFRVLTHRKKS